MSPRRVCERRSVNALTTVSWPSPTTHTYAWDQIRRLIPASPSRVSSRDEIASAETGYSHAIFGRSRPSSRDLAPTVKATVADHRDPRLRRRACCRDRKSGRNETGDVRLAPAQPATRVRTWLRDTTELGQQRVPALRSEQPCEGLFLFGVRLAKVLERSDREHAIDEVLGSTPRSYPTCIGIPGSLLEHLVREHRWAPARDSGIGCAAHIRRNRLPK